MKPNHYSICVIAIQLLLVTANAISQTADSTDDSFLKDRKQSKFHTGLYLGVYFANKHTANLYDGYGYDYNGVKNDFANSFMYRKIIVEYGGGNGQPDQIAQALSVNQGDWSFNQSDMPLKMRYLPSFIMGIQGRFSIGKKAALLLSANATRLNLNGSFTIQIITPPVGPQQPNYQNQKIFSITGAEQRVLLQAGLQRLFGSTNDPVSILVEGGPSVNMVKFSKNQLHINNLLIDLTTYYNEQGMEVYRAKNLTGVGLGAFAGIGLNFTVKQDWSMQLLYTPSYDRITIGQDPQPKLQHAIGLRIYYDL